MASGLHESSGQDMQTFLDESSEMASSGAAAAPPRAQPAAAAPPPAEEDAQDQPGEGECGGGEWEEWDQEEQERIVKKCCPEIAVLKDGGKIQAPWHRFIPNHKNLGPHWVCELCVAKNGRRRQSTQEHLQSTEHINKIGKGDPPNRLNLNHYEKQKNIRIVDVVSHSLFGGPSSEETDGGGNKLALQAPGASTPAVQPPGLGAPGAAAAAHQQGPRAHSTSACQRPTRAAASTSDDLNGVVKKLNEAVEQQAIAMKHVVDMVEMTGNAMQQMNTRLDSLGFMLEALTANHVNTAVAQVAFGPVGAMMTAGGRDGGGGMAPSAGGGVGERSPPQHAAAAAAAADGGEQSAAAGGPAGGSAQDQRSRGGGAQEQDGDNQKWPTLQQAAAAAAGGGAQDQKDWQYWTQEQWDWWKKQEKEKDGGN